MLKNFGAISDNSFNSMQEKKESALRTSVLSTVFSVDGKSIRTYLIEQDKYVPIAGITHHGSADYYYSANMKIEKALGGFETLTSNDINSIIASPKAKMEGKDAMALYVFTMIQIGRTPAFVKQLEENANKMGTMMRRKYVETMLNTEKEDGFKKLLMMSSMPFQ